MEVDKFYPSLYKRLQKLLNSLSYVFAILRDKTLKFGLFTNVKVLFSAVSMVFLYLSYIRILNYRDQGL